MHFTGDTDLIVVLLWLSCEKSYILQSGSMQKQRLHNLQLDLCSRYRFNCSAPLSVFVRNHTFCCQGLCRNYNFTADTDRHFTADTDLIVELLCVSCEKSYILQSGSVQKQAFYSRYRSNCRGPLAVVKQQPHHNACFSLFAQTMMTRQI